MQKEDTQARRVRMVNQRLTKSERIKTIRLLQKIECDAHYMTPTQYEYIFELISMNIHTIEMPQRTVEQEKALDQFCKIISEKYCTKCSYKIKCCMVHDTEEPCFYFKNGKCQIYNMRPLLCKNFVCDVVTPEQVRKFFSDKGLGIAIIKNTREGGLERAN